MRSTRLALVFLVMVGFTGNLLAQQPFTYQGMLRVSGVPANGNYDFQFSLWTANPGGSQVGSTLTRIGVSVGNGLFTAELDFGNVWDGNDRFLQVAVRPSGGGSYTTLSPRVKVNRSPYSQLAYSALAVPWSGITGMPAGFADGVDNDTTYTAGAGLQLTGNTFSIANSGVVSAMLADGSVVTSKLADGAVSSAKIADGSVTTAKIANGAVTDAKLSDTGVSAGTYGSATLVPQITVNAQGRVTGVTNVALSGGPPSGPAGGDLTGTYPNPAIAANAVNNAKLASDTASLGKVSGGLLYTDGSLLGIGTNTPASRLHVVAGTGTDAAQIIQTGSGRGLLVQAGQDTAIWGVTGTGFAGVDGRGLFTGVLGFAYADTGINAGGRFVTASPQGHGLEAFSLSGNPQTVARLSTTFDPTLTWETGLRAGGTAMGEVGLYGLSVTGTGTGVGGESENWHGVLGLTLTGRGVIGMQVGSESSSGTGVAGYAQSARAVAVRAINVQNGPALSVEGQIVVPGANLSDSTPVFKHVATSGNTTLHITYINHPMCNGDPDAILLITHDWGTSGPYVNRPTGVWYDHRSAQWTIFIEDRSAMPTGAIFNVLVIKSGVGGTLGAQSFEQTPGMVAPDTRR